MPGKTRPLALWVALLALLVLLIGLALALLGSTVMLPQGSVVVLGALACGVFLAVQLLLFRWLGLRSPADEDDRPDPDDPDWRAWRG